MSCPCGLGESLETCCGPFIQGKEKPPTAEKLMRSRYTAYATGEVEYIGRTHHPKDREQFDREAALRWSKESTWHGIQIVSVQKGGTTDDEGFVEFVANYDVRGQMQRHHERSRFQRVDGDWYYVDGEMVKQTPFRKTSPEIGRNDPCPCGSGKKYKHCHLGKSLPVA
jgi:SEC-C motif-containing protein